MKLLAISTSTEYCSAALQIGSQLSERELPAERAAGERILELVDVLLAEARITLRQLDAIAFGRGPGAFTGVRLAASVTQGLAAACDLPVIPVSDLLAIAQQVVNLPGAAERVLICQDARMGEVYWGWFGATGGNLVPMSEERVSSPATVSSSCNGSYTPHIRGAGSGFAAYPELLQLFEGNLEQVFPLMHPRAREIAQLATMAGLGAARPAVEAQPVYVRDQVATVPGSVP